MHRVWLLSVLGACVQPPPHATITIDRGLSPKSHAVLVVPTTCTSLGYAALCTPATFFASTETLPPNIPDTFGGYIDPPLRLKLELAGFTLAEAGALRVTTADRVDVDATSEQIAGEGPQTVADLGVEDVRSVATSLGLASLLVPALTLRPVKYGMQQATLAVRLLDVATMRPRWTVTCSEVLISPDASTNRLANCAGNGILAILSPENLIGKAL